MEKLCRTCSTVKAIKEFNRKGEGQWQAKCRACQRAYYKNYYDSCDKERTRLRAKNAQRRTEINALINAKKSVPCADCGVTYPPYIMDFDHLGDKDFNIANGKLGALSKVLAEIEKCEVVCSNCHRERTHSRRQSPVV